MLDFIQVGDLGKERDNFLGKVTRTVGKGNWYWAFNVKKKFYSWEFGFQLYEDAIWQYLRSNPVLLQSLVRDNVDVFQINRFDIEAGLSYKIQTQNTDHYNDIAIRRCLVRFGINFQGKDLFDLKSTSYCHSKIPFHLPHLINKPDEIKSVKSWLETNRYIVIATETKDFHKFIEMLVK